MNKEIALSLFDGMSCGQIALNESGHEVKYYASEIDKFAISQTQLNFPDTIQLGDIENWRKWNIDWSKIGLILAGSPCQGFSFAGKQLNFNDERSKLFFVFVDILNHCKKFNPDVKFLLENVNMKKEYQKVINDMLGLFPVRINSNLVSAQNRDRLYWTNIKIKMVGLFNEVHSDIPQPKDRGILLKDILQPESDVDGKYYLSDKMINGFVNKKTKGFENRFKPIENTEVKANCLNVSTAKMVISDNYIKLDKQLNKKADQNKAGCLIAGAHSGGNHSDMDIMCVSMVGRKLDENGTRKDYDKNIKAVQQLEVAPENKTNCLTSVQKDNLIMQINPSKESGGKQPFQHNRVYDVNGIIPALCVDARSPIIPIDYKLRRLTPLECARLQTIPSSYIWNCNDTQQYKMLGNGFTVSVISHILSFMK